MRMIHCPSTRCAVQDPYQASGPAGRIHHFPDRYLRRPLTGDTDRPADEAARKAYPPQTFPMYFQSSQTALSEARLRRSKRFFAAVHSLPRLR